MTSSEHERANRAFWDAKTESYQAEHAEHIGHDDPRWGVWQLPESELQVLGEVAGKDVLELGCGGAQWSILLARRGARPVGLDYSERQLEHARRLQAEAGVDFPLLHASAEDVPLPDESFDVVFCDWGATTFTDPYRAIPEAARLLRPGGLLAFSGGTPIDWICWNETEDRLGDVLERDYFGMHRWKTPEGSVEFMLPYGEWIRLFRESGLAVEDLLELRPPEHATSTFRDANDLAWARCWPHEQIWKARKE